MPVATEDAMTGRRHIRACSLAAAIILSGGRADAQFSHLPAVEKNFTASMAVQASAHDHRALVFGIGSNVVTLLTLDNRLLRATTSYNYGDVFPVPSAVAGVPYGAFGVKTFDAARGVGTGEGRPEPELGDFWAVGAGGWARTSTPLREGVFKSEQKGQRINVLLIRCLFSLRGFWTPRWTTAPVAPSLPCTQ
jgi:hypothetical protein